MLPMCEDRPDEQIAVDAMSAATLGCVCRKGLLMRQLLERPMEGSAAKLRAIEFDCFVKFIV